MIKTFSCFYNCETLTGDTTEKKKSKKKKNLFVTDMFDDGFDTEEEESQETLTQISSGSSGNTSNLISMLTSLLDSTVSENKVSIFLISIWLLD